MAAASNQETSSVLQAIGIASTAVAGLVTAIGGILIALRRGPQPAADAGVVTALLDRLEDTEADRDRERAERLHTQGLYETCQAELVKALRRR